MGLKGAGSHSKLISSVNNLPKLDRLSIDKGSDVDQYNDLLETVKVMLRIPKVYDQEAIMSCVTDMSDLLNRIYQHRAFSSRVHVDLFRIVAGQAPL